MRTGSEGWCDAVAVALVGGWCVVVVDEMNELFSMGFGKKEGDLQ